MIKIVFCLRRKADMSQNEFQQYWKTQHKELVLANAQALGIRRYVQSHTLDCEFADRMRAYRQTPEPYDGIAELWYDSVAALEAASATDTARRASRTLRDDEEKFIDLVNSPMWIVEELEMQSD